MREPPPAKSILSGSVLAFEDVAHFHHAIVVGGVNVAEGVADDFHFDLG